MQEPVRSVRGRHPGTLVRAIDGSRSPGHHNPFLPRPPGAGRTQHGLPTGSHAAGRSKNIVPLPSLVELGSLDGGLGEMAVKNNAGRPFQAGSIGRERCHKDHALVRGAGPGAAMGQIGLSILIPERARVDKALFPHHPHRLRPAPARIPGAHHKNAPVRVSHVNVEPAVMVADGRCPDAVPVFYAFPESRLIVPQGSAGEFPVHQVLRLQDGQARKTVEGRRRHVIPVPYPAHIRV